MYNFFALITPWVIVRITICMCIDGCTNLDLIILLLAMEIIVVELCVYFYTHFIAWCFFFAAAVIAFFSCAINAFIISNKTARMNCERRG